MKRLTCLTTSLLLAGASLMPAFAQTDKPNRLLVVDNDGDYQSFVIDYEEEATFIHDGEVIAEVIIYEVQTTEMMISILRTEDCNSFSLSILPAAAASKMSDLSMVKFVEEDNPTRYYQDFITDPDDPETAARIEGIDLEPATDYVVITVGYDDWNIASGVGVFPFTTPAGASRIGPDLEGKVLASDGRIFELPAKPVLSLK